MFVQRLITTAAPEPHRRAPSALSGLTSLRRR